MANIIRVPCTLPDHEADWVEFDSTNWTMGETRRFENETDVAKILGIIIRRLVKCHITDINGKVISTITKPEDLDDAAEEIYGWLAMGMYRMIGAKRQLGNLSALASSTTSVKSETPAQTTEK